MKKMQDMEIKGMWFQVKELSPRNSANAIVAANDHRYTYADIYEAYQKPSEAKVSIWNEWIQWARDVNMFDDTHEVKNLSISARTNQMFTVCAIIREFDEEEIGYYLGFDEDVIGNYLPVATYIMIATKYHNYLYKLASDESGEDIDLCW